MSESISSTHSETLNECQPYTVEILNEYARLLSIQSVREALSAFESCSRLDCGPVTNGVRNVIELSININVPVLDSRVRQTRIVTKSCGLARGQAVCQVQTNIARNSYPHLSENYTSYAKAFQ